MAIFVAVNFLGVKVLATPTAPPPGGRSPYPRGDLHHRGDQLPPAQLHLHGFAPFGAKGVLSAISTSGIIFALLASSRPSSSRERAATQA